MAVQQILANRVLETTLTQSTGAYSLEGPSTGYNSFASKIASGAKVSYCVQQITYDGSGEVTAIDYEVGIGTLTHGSPDSLARTTILDSSNGGSAVDWGTGTKTIFAADPAELLPLLDAPLTAGQAGKALIVNSGSTGFTLGGPYFPAAGGTISGTGTLLTLLRTENDTNLREHLRFERGSGAGNPLVFQLRGDAADGVDLLRMNFAAAQNFDFYGTGQLVLPVDGTGNGAVRKSQMDTAITAATPDASTAVKGLVEIADASEVTAASSNVLSVPPGRMVYHPGVAKAWVAFDGTSLPGTLDGFGVSSVTSLSTGRYRVTFSTAFANANYAVATANATSAYSNTHVYDQTTAKCDIGTNNNGSSGAANLAYVSAVFYGDWA